MDFFSAQERARRITGWLIAYFVAAVVLIIVAVYFAAMLLATTSQEAVLSLWRPQLFLVSSMATLLLLGGGTAFRLAQLASGGGASVAESLGGRRVARESVDPAERRLLNVVDEMAIASGVPVPPVYLLEQEHSINAFAAGTATNDAIVAVTRGALEQLSRDELQGVIAHEFSHILNGDMRLNLRLVGLLFGILLLATIGRILLRGGGRRGGRGAGTVGIFGLALLLIGYIGVFFGRLIQAAVSRQREYLADASAVQFTRHPPGIAGALKKIAGVGSVIHHPRAEEASHLYFGEGIDSWFASHPPVEERIRRIEPGFALAAPPSRESWGSGEFAISPKTFAAGAGQLGPAHVAYAQALVSEIPEWLTQALRHTEGARAVIYGLLLSSESTTGSEQLRLVGARESAALSAQAEEYARWIRRADARLRLPLVDMALPSLMQLEPEECERFLAVTDALVRSDKRIELFEYTLQRILSRHLRPRARRVSHTLDVRAIGADCVLLLSALAYTGNRGDAVATAFDAARKLAPLDGEWRIVPRDAVVLSKLDVALDRLATLAPRFKRRLVEACVAAVESDGRMTVAESELLRAICEALEVPMPPLIAAG